MISSSENLLKTATGATPPTLTYDPAMRLWELAAGTGSTRFAYDGLGAVAQYDELGTLWRRYVHGPAVDEPVVQYQDQGAVTRRFLHADERGSIVAMSDSAGTVTAIDSYDEFGKRGAANQSAFGYTGQLWLGQVGAWYYKTRIYAPHLGRFLQPDPIGYEGGMNLYAYVGNDPVNLTDPLGLYWVEVQQCRRVDAGTPEEPISWGTVCYSNWVNAYVPGGGLHEPRMFWDPWLFGGGRPGTQNTQQRICNTPLRGGSTIRQNVATIEAMRQGEMDSAGWSNTEQAAAGSGSVGFWTRRVAPSGAWAGRLGEPWGNWNYGATGRAAGIPLEVLLRAAGAAEQFEALTGRTGSGSTGQGNPFGAPPYGDNPWSQQEIVEGYNARCN